MSRRVTSSYAAVALLASCLHLKSQARSVSSGVVMPYRGSHVAASAWIETPLPISQTMPHCGWGSPREEGVVDGDCT